MDKLCETLIKTYNSNYLNDKSHLIQSAFFIESKKNKNKHKGYDILMKLIYNHYKMVKPVSDHISGPRTLSLHYDRKHGKTIYIFGETHGRDDNCNSSPKEIGTITTIADYMTRLSKTTDVFIDLFIEIPMFAKTKYNSPFGMIKKNTYINDLTNTFVPCIQTESRHDVSCSLIRAHYANARAIDREGTNLVQIFYKESYSWTTYKDASEDSKQFINDIINNDYKKMAEILFESMMNVKQVKKEHNRSYLSHEINKFMKFEVKLLVLNTFVKSKRYAKKIKKNLYISTTDARCLADLILPWNNPLMDYYTLTRLYKKMDIKKTPFKKGKYDNQPDEARNVIIYAGNNHSINIRRFLNSIGCEEIKHISYSRKLRCLDLSGFPQPFFTNTL